MKLLALDTSAEACSVAFWIDGKIFSRTVITVNRHTEIVLPLLDQLRAETQLPLQDLDGIAFGAGPGAFTGVRTAASVAHGIALACGCPVVAVSSLAALARAGWRETAVATQLALLDARRGEVYWGLYTVPDADHAIALVVDAVQSPTQIQSPNNSWCAVGRGWEVYADILTARLRPTVVASAECRYPDAEDIAALAVTELNAGRGRSLRDALPVYLRAPV